MKKIIILSFILILIFSNISFATNETTVQKNNKINYAKEIVMKLKKNNDIVTLKKTSLNIEIPNIDLGKYIEEKQKKARNTSKDDRYISSSTIEHILKLYPELDKNELATWTYSMYYEYDRFQTNLKRSPTNEEIVELNKRNILIDDAKNLKKIYGSYQALLEQNDKDLVKSLEDLYLSNLESAENLVIKSNTEGSIVQYGPIEPPDNSTTYTYKLGGDKETYLKYYWCNVSGYGWDWFLEDSETHKYDNNIEYGGAANVLFQKLYNTTSNYSSASMWGSFSVSRQWPHEAIDFNYGRGATIYAAFSDNPSRSGDASLYLAQDYYGRIVYTCGYDFRQFTVSLQHTGPTRISSSTFKAGVPIGTESGYGANSSPTDFSSHTHFSVREGINYTWDVYDATLDSDSPYAFTYRHFY